VFPHASVQCSSHESTLAIIIFKRVYVVHMQVFLNLKSLPHSPCCTSWLEISPQNQDNSVKDVRTWWMVKQKGQNAQFLPLSRYEKCP